LHNSYQADPWAPVVKVHRIRNDEDSAAAAAGMTTSLADVKMRSVVPSVKAARYLLALTPYYT